MIPNDPIILLSFLNTRLRDGCSSLDELCIQLDLDRNEIEETLAGVGYSYDQEHNRFV